MLTDKRGVQMYFAIADCIGSPAPRQAQAGHVTV